MKRRILLVMLALTIVMGPALFFGCDLAPEFKSLAEDLFYDAVKKVAPTFTDTTSSGVSSRATTSWDWGDPIYELYGILLDGEWGGYFNLYETMQECDRYFSEISESGVVITEQQINAPVDVGFNGEAANSTYDTYYEYNGDDYDEGDQNQTRNFGRVDGDKIYVLHTSFNQNDGKSKAVTQGWYDQATGDLEIGIFYANYLDPADQEAHESDGWEIVRAFISGNTEDHTFSLKVIRNGTGYDHNVVGYGISEGSGEYFLMQIANEQLEFTNTKYYEFAADATADEIQAMDAAGSDTVSANTAGYEDNLPTNFTPGVLLTESEVEDLNVLNVAYE